MGVLMDILSFVSTISKTISATRVREDLDSLRKELDENLVPLYVATVNQMKNKPLQSEWGRMLEQEVYRTLPHRRGQNYLEATRRAFANMSNNLKVVEALVLEHFSKDTPREGLSYTQANLIQFLSHARFAARYAIQTLNRLLANEICHLIRAEDKVDDYLTPAEKSWMASNFKLYFSTLAALDIPTSEFTAKLNSIPGIQVSDSKLAMGVHGINKLEPFRSNFFGGVNVTNRLNFIYHIRQGWAEFQVNNLMRMKEEKKTIELRLLRLKELQQGKNNPRLEQAIEYNEGRLQRISAKIADLEEQYIGDA